MKSSKYRVNGRYATRKQWIMPRFWPVAGFVIMTGITSIVSLSKPVPPCPEGMNDVLGMCSMPDYSKKLPSLVLDLGAQVVKASEPESTPVPSSVEEKIRAKFGKNAEKALKIARCESDLRPDAVGDMNIRFWGKDGTQYGSSHGVFQVRHLKGRPTPSELQDVDTNINLAYEISNHGTNWNPWLNCKRKTGV